MKGFVEVEGGGFPPSLLEQMADQLRQPLQPHLLPGAKPCLLSCLAGEQGYAHAIFEHAFVSDIGYRDKALDGLLVDAKMSRERLCSEMVVVLAELLVTRPTYSVEAMQLLTLASLTVNDKLSSMMQSVDTAKFIPTIMFAAGRVSRSGVGTIDEQFERVVAAEAGEPMPMASTLVIVPMAFDKANAKFIEFSSKEQVT